MGEFPDHTISAYSGTIDIDTGCTSTLPRGTLSTCRSDTPIMGIRHVRLYPLDIVTEIDINTIKSFNFDVQMVLTTRKKN